MLKQHQSNISIRHVLKTTIGAFIFFFPFIAAAQSPFKGFENLFIIPNNYTISYTTKAPLIDGDLNDKVWQQAKWTANFRDIEGDLK